MEMCIRDRLETLKAAGPIPCPPMVVGVGIGGTFDKAAYLAKKALIRPIEMCIRDSTWTSIFISLQISIRV